MATLSDLHSLVPYNVMVTPPLKEGKNWDAFTEVITELKNGWTEFEKTGYRQDFQNVLKNGLAVVKSNNLDYTAFAKSLLSFARLAPGGEFIVPVASALIDFIFPYLFGGGNNQESMFYQEIINQVEKIIDSRFQNFTIKELNNHAKNIANDANAFSNTIQEAIGNPQKTTNGPRTPSTQNLNKISNTYTDIARDIQNHLNFFEDLDLSPNPSTARNTILFILPMYVTNITILLSIHQGYIQFMTKWQNVYTDPGDIDQLKININTAKSTLRNFIRDYSQKVYNMYNRHLPSVSYNSKQQLQTYIKYNRVMMTQVFDIVALWPSFYPDDYVSGLNTDQTRIAFGDLIGPVEMKKKMTDIKNSQGQVIDTVYDEERNYRGGDYYNLHFKLYDIYRNMLPNDDIFNYFYEGFQLKHLNFLTIGNPNCTSNRFCYLKDFFATYQNYNGTSYYQTWSGSSYNKNTYYPGYNDTCNARSHDSCRDLTGYCVNLNDADKLRYMNMESQESKYLAYTALSIDGNSIAGCNPLTSSPQYGGNSENNIVDSQKIQAIYGVVPDNAEGNLVDARSQLGFIYTLVDYNLSPQNIIGQRNDDGTVNQAIRGFPAEKGTLNLTTTPLTKVFEPINSAAAVKLTQYQILTLPITNLTAQNYNIRVRYASNSDISIYFHVQTPGKDLNRGSQTLKNTENITENIPTVKGKNGKYALHTLANTISLPSGSSAVYIQNNSHADLFVDRIEFAPIEPNIPVNIPVNIPDYTLNDYDEHEIWKSTTQFGAVLTGKTCPAGLVDAYSDIQIKYWNNNTLIKTISQWIGDPEIYDDRCIPIKKLTQGTFNRITAQVKPGSQDMPFFNIVLKDLAIDLTTQNFTTPEDLEKITNQVNELFTSSSQTELVETVTDYKIDQVVMKVDALSDDVFGVEKKALRKLMNQAKQLSKARNILVGGNFEKGHEWALGREATMVANHELFKGDHLLLPPPALYPSYAYQKVDESKLKPNTRYTVSGFIAQSEHLEVIISRYGKEVHDMLNVPYEEALPISSDESPNCCKPAVCQCPSCNGSQPDSHFFSYSIDVGSVKTEVNLGIEFGLRIAKPNGFAKISNLEIKEDRPLTEKEIKKVQRKEQKWKKAFDQEQAEITATLQSTLNQINGLYENEDWNGSVHPHVTYQHLSTIVLPTLPQQTHWFMEDRQGELYSVTQQFQEALDRAFQQLEEQNLIHNGNFTNGLTDWTVTGDVQITIYDEDPILEIAHWDASVSQTIEITDFEEETEYKLRVRAKGKGTITVQHEEELVETMTFHTDSFTTQEQTFYFEENTVDVHVQSENNSFLIDSVELIKVIEE